MMRKRKSKQVLRDRLPIRPRTPNTLLLQYHKRQGALSPAIRRLVPLTDPINLVPSTLNQPGESKGHLSGTLLGAWSLCAVLYLFTTLFCPSASADTYQEVQSDIRSNAQAVIAEVNTASANYQQELQSYSSTGSQFLDPSYVEHPWRNGNPDWENVWKNLDDQIIKKGFNEYRDECFDMQILGCCCRGSCEDCPWAYTGYWWPEVVITLNNFCISALMGPQGSVVTDSSGSQVSNPSGYSELGLDNGGYMDFHGGCFRDADSWNAALDSILGPQVGERIRAGLPEANIPGGDSQTFPAQLRNLPHRGNSAVTSIGVSANGIETTNLEAHLYRTWTDVQAEAGDYNPLAGWAECFTPKCVKPWLGDAPWPRLMTENADRDMQARWRFPERSHERVYGGPSCNNRYEEEWEGVPEIANLSPSDVPDNLRALQAETCASYRVSDEGEQALHWRNPIDEPLPRVRLGIQSNSSDELAQNCLQPEVGQVYPLTGQFQSDSEAAGTISLALRANEWGSWCKWNDSARSNVFNYKGATYSNFHTSTQGKNTVTTNTNRTSGYFFGARSSTYVAWPTPPDKLQRIYPVKDRSDTCFTIDEADKRLRPDLFPPGLYAGNTTGETRFVIWNYRTCCVCPGCDSSEELNCIPVTE